MKLLQFSLLAATGLALAPVAEAQVIAYEIAPGTLGNQSFGGSLGLDFNVNAPVDVIELGAFDSGSDGLTLPITVELWQRNDGGTPADFVDDFGVSALATLDFSPGDPGALVGGSRFKALAAPLSLTAGSYTIVATGYGDGEQNGNTPTPAANGRTTNDSAGTVDFVGSSRWGDAFTFPANADGGPEQRYAAGTFSYELPDADDDGIPDAVEDAEGLDRDNPDDADDDADMDGSSNLQEFQNGTGINDPDSDDDTVNDGDEVARGSDPLNGDSDRDGLGDGIETGSMVLIDEDDTGSSSIDFDSDDDGFHDGIELFGLSDPNTDTSTAATTFGLEAYSMENAREGNQGFLGTLGLDFDLNGTVQVQQLGAFDDGGDGLVNPITVEVWQRNNSGTPADTSDDIGVSILGMMMINPGEGALQGANRFKRLPEALELEPGSYTIVAHGYGPDDLNNNAGPLEPDTFGQTVPDTVTIDFVGSSRFGADGTEGLFPDSIDGGAPNQYAAGTFSYTTEDTDGDGMPDFWEDDNGLDKDDAADATGNPDGDGLDNLAEFQNNTDPNDADTDDDMVNDDVEIADGTDPLNPDSDGDGLDDGAEKVAMTDPNNPDSDDDGFSDGREVAAGTDPNLDTSFPELSFLGELAYNIVSGTTGNQEFGGALGADFVVNEPVFVVELGAFDSGADGLALPITVRLWSRNDGGTPADPADDSGIEIVTQLEFSGIDQGDLRDGHRVRRLAEPLLLPVGSYTIVASGYGAGEPNGNLGVPTPPLDGGLMSISNDPALTFVGGARFGNAPAAFPPTADAGPEYRYAAGTFAFETLPEAPFEITAVSYDPVAEMVTLTWNSVPNTSYSVFSSPNLENWEEITDDVGSGGTSTTESFAAPPGALFYRVVLP